MRVQQADGRIEPRTVRIGLNSRVRAQVLDQAARERALAHAATGNESDSLPFAERQETVDGFNTNIHHRIYWGPGQRVLALTPKRNISAKWNSLRTINRPTQAINYPPKQALTDPNSRGMRQHSNSRTGE